MENAILFLSKKIGIANTVRLAIIITRLQIFTLRGMKGALLWVTNQIESQRTFLNDWTLEQTTLALETELADANNVILDKDKDGNINVCVTPSEVSEK